MSDVLAELMGSTDSDFASWKPDGTELSNIGDLAAELLVLQRRVEDIEGDLKEAKGDMRLIQEGKLPAALEQAGLSEIRLESGEKVKVSTFYNCSIDAINKEGAFEWLHEQGHGDIVKHTVSLGFKKGEAEEADSAVEILKKAGFNPSDEVKIAPQTLKAFARVEVEAGRQLPEFFKLYIGQKATIK